MGETINRAALVQLGVKYALVYAGVTVLLVYLGSQVLDYVFGLAAFVMLFGSLIVVSLLFGASSDIAFDTAEAGGEAGFHGITNISQYRSETVRFPGKLQLGVYLGGIAAYSAGALLVLT